MTPKEAPVRERPTLATIAAALGVSRATVSNAYNRPDQLSPLLRERILATAAALGYAGPDPAARSLRQGRVGAVGVLTSDRLSYAFSDPVAVLLLDGLAEVLEPEGSGLLILAGVDGGGPPPELVRNAVVDGLVVYCLADDDPALAVARARRVPLVVIGEPPPRAGDEAGTTGTTTGETGETGEAREAGTTGKAATTATGAAPGTAAAEEARATGEVVIVVDDLGGGAAAGRHLVDLGHRRIAVVTFELARDRRCGPARPERQAAVAFSGTRERLGGYRSALVGAGLDWSDVTVWECTHNGRQVGREAATALLQMRPRPTAILAMSDELAIGALDAARDAGIDVPGELSVVGFDDVPAAAHTTPPLTTVRQPLRRKGELAGERLLDLRAGRPAARVELPTELVIRRSTAPPPD